jgi:Flp pilus assembly pilin Flp
MDCTMIGYLTTWLKLKADRPAVTALEYALMAGVLALAVLTASSILGSGIDNAFSDLARVL